MRNATSVFEYSSVPLSLADTILLITIAGYEIRTIASISHSFINRLYNCVGKCSAAVKYSTPGRTSIIIAADIDRQDADEISRRAKTVCREIVVNRR